MLKYILTAAVMLASQNSMAEVTMKHTAQSNALGRLLFVVQSGNTQTTVPVAVCIDGFAKQKTCQNYEVCSRDFAVQAMDYGKEANYPNAANYSNR